MASGPTFKNVRNKERVLYPQVPKSVKEYDPELAFYLEEFRKKIIEKDYLIAKDLEDIYTDLASLIP